MIVVSPQKRLLPLIAGLALIPFFALIFYTFPASDDYWFYTKYLNNGHNLILATIEHYSTWEHRISSYFLATLPVWFRDITGLPIFTVYQIYGFITSLFIPFAFFYLYRSLWAKNSWRLLGLVLSGTLLFIVGLPFNLENFYWPTDKAFWTIPGLLLMSWGIFIFNRVKQNERVTWFHWVFSALTLVFIALFNQFAGLAAFLYCAVLTASTFFKKPEGTKLAGFFFTLTAISLLALLITAIGNPRVTDSTVQSVNLDFQAVLTAAGAYAKHFCKHAFLPSFPIWFACYTLVSSFVIKEAESWVVAKRFLLWPITFLALTMPVACTLIHLLVTSEPPPPRVMGMLHIFFFTAVTCWAFWHPLPIAKLLPQRGIREALVVLVFVLAVFTNPYTNQVVSHLNSDDLAAWEKDHWSRYERLKKLDETDEVRVESFEHYYRKLPILMWYDLSPEKNFWVNKSYASFYGVKSIEPYLQQPLPAEPKKQKP